MKALTLSIVICIWIFTVLNTMIINPQNTTQIVNGINNYQTTIDSLINKNDWLHESLRNVWDENANKNIQIDKLTRDNKYLRRITR